MSQAQLSNGVKRTGHPEAITTLFFDMGMTLAGLKTGWHGVYHQIFQRAGYDLPLGEVEQAVSESWAQVATEDPTAEYEANLEFSRTWQREVEERVMQRLDIHPAVREDIFWQILQAFEDPATYELYPEVLPTLDKLQAAGYRMAIISNWGWHLPELCQALGLTPYFEQIFTSARVGYAKPNPKIFHYVLDQMRINPAQGLHTGDSLSADVGGAWGVGLGALWLVRPADQPLYDEEKLKLIPSQVAVQISSLEGVLEYLGLEK